ncbi:MAG: CHAT domain-containing protein [Leptolyngbya sp. SIO3F4]|nr:CHAT domain-containing protein [Leptolyngbya sp. SIO3F4]
MNRYFSVPAVAAALLLVTSVGVPASHGQSLSDVDQACEQLSTCEINSLIEAGLADGEVAQPIGGGVPGLEFFEAALTLARQNNNIEAEARIFNHVGEAYRRLGQYPKALARHQHALEISPSAQTKGDSLNGIGQVHTSFGRISEALITHQQALELLEQEGLSTSETWRYLGAAHTENRQWDQALNAYETAERTAQNTSDRAAALQSIGEIYLEQNKLQASITNYQTALDLWRDIDNAQGIQTTLTQLGGAHHLQRKYNEALETYEAALIISRTRSDLASEATLLQNMGISYGRSGDWDSALVKLYEATALFDELGYRALEGETLSQIGNILKAQGNQELAIALYKQAIEVFEHVRQDLRVLPLEQRSVFPRTFAETYRTLADLLLQQDRVIEAQAILDLLKVQEIDDYLDDVPETDTPDLGETPLQPAETQLLELYDQTVAEGRELAKLRRIPRSQRTPSQQQRIAELVTSQQTKTAEFNDFIARPDVSTLVDQLGNASQQQNLNLRNLNSLQDNLQTLENAVLVYPLILEDRLELVLVSAYAPPLHRTVEVTADELQTALENARQALKNRRTDARPAMEALYTYLVKPLETDLAQANAQTIVYSPDGPLRYVPLGALYDGTQWLVERFQVTNITAASLTDFDAVPAPNPSILAAAFSEGQYNLRVGTRQISLAGLPYAKVEVNTLVDKFADATQLLNDAFNRPTTIPQMDDYSIVHLATHAEFVSGQPEESFILFGDGDRVSLRDVSTWSLRNVDLVVLSACQTGLGGTLGNGEEILGFGYQIQRVGAKSAIASLWSVDDGGTQALMTSFYDNLRQGYGKSEALRQAQIALITDDRQILEANQRGFAQEFKGPLPNLPSSYNHPYYWSSFILIGNSL